MTGSPFKEALRGLKPGQTATVMGPLGDLLFNPKRPAVFLAGGIGVTPFRGMLRYAADIGATEPVRMLYSARVPEEFAFRAELESLAAAHPQFQIHYTVTRPGDSPRSWEGRTGRIDIPWVREIEPGAPAVEVLRRRAPGDGGRARGRPQRTDGDPRRGPRVRVLRRLLRPRREAGPPGG